jgi:hypothetical protein
MKTFKESFMNEVKITKSSSDAQYNSFEFSKKLKLNIPDDTDFNPSFIINGTDEVEVTTDELRQLVSFINKNI